jgi:hypothetical protein
MSFDLGNSIDRAKIKFYGLYLDMKKLEKSIPIKSQAEVSRFALKSVERLKQAAPVDKGDYKASWAANRNVSARGIGNNIASAQITNSKVYGVAIEEGSVPGETPWPRASGVKTVVGPGGRIFSSQAVGGTLKFIITDASGKELADKIANGIFKVIE